MSLFPGIPEVMQIFRFLIFVVFAVSQSC